MPDSNGTEPPRDGPVLVDIEEHVATVTLNRPTRLNALTSGSVAELRDRLTSLARDPTIRVVVLTGAGRAFSAGADMEDLANMAMSDAVFIREAVRVGEVLYEMRPVTIAAVNGVCAGGAMALACSADLRIASESALFTSAYVRIGTPGDLGLSWHLTRLVGLSKAKELSLLSERVGAEEAVRIGLVNRVVPDDQFRATVKQVARQVAAFAPLGTAGMKRNLNDALTLDLPEFLDVESRRWAENAATEDAAEAVRAFVERRPPIFRGR